MEVIKKKDFEECLLNQKSFSLKKAIEGNTIQAIPLEKIKQTKAEIELYKPLNVLELTSAMATDGHEVRICKEFAIAILDKLIAESEG